jgi:hypothetical protein
VTRGRLQHSLLAAASRERYGAYQTGAAADEDSGGSNDTTSIDKRFGSAVSRRPTDFRPGDLLYVSDTGAHCLGVSGPA